MSGESGESGEKTILVDVEEGIGLITLNRPSSLNAVTHEMHGRLAGIWRELEDDDDVGVVILTGAGRGFCSGADLKAPTPDYARVLEMMEFGRRRTHELLDFGKPVISAINGPAVGLGCALALTADISIAAEDAVINDGHIGVGVAAGDHAVLVWPQLVGMARAKYLLFTGRGVTGKEAAEMGLVSLSVPGERVLETAKEVARDVLAQSATAVRWTKAALNHQLRSHLPAHELSTAYEMLGLLGTDAHRARDDFRSGEAPSASSSL